MIKTGDRILYVLSADDAMQINRRRAAGNYPKVTKRATTASGSALLTIEQLRSTYTDGYNEAMASAKSFEAKLEVLDDVEAALKAAK